MTSTPPSPKDLTPQEKRELVEKLLRERAAQGSKPPAAESAGEQAARPVIQPVDRAQRYFPLSTAQQRLWLLDQFSPGNPAYNVSVMVRLKGRLHLPALQKTLAAIQERHEILRVNFTVEDGKPVQFLQARRDFPLAIFDLTGQGEGSPQERAEVLAEEESQRSFDLAQDPLARANLFRLAEEDHLFQFIVHHIVFDGLSLGVLLQELTACYSAFVENRPVNLPPLPVQYIDYAAWDAVQFQDDRSREQMAYWKKQLGGDLPILDMPLDQPRPEIQTFRAGKEQLEISAALTEAVNAISREEGVTLFVTMLSVFYILLARYTAQEDIIVGTPIARRIRPEVEKLIGVFLNNLALRADLSGNLNFRELLKRVRHTALDAFAHQEIPFEKLLNELHIERDSSHTPVFQVFFNLLDLRKGLKLELPGLTVETPSLPEIGSIFDITLYVQNWGSTLKLKLVYNADIFSRERMAEFLQRYHHLLEQVTASPDRPVFSFPLPSQTRAHQAAIIEGFNELDNAYTPFEDEAIYQSLPACFESVVSRYPHSTAVKTPQHEWTYEQLNRRANRIAHGILSGSDSAKDRVALLFDHDAPMIAGMLGALKAGKTYIPLDPYYPQQRLDYMLEDSWAGAIVTNSGQMTLARALAGDRHPVINIDELGEGPDDNPCLEISPDMLAYILYTSGSTGQPKGVMQIHRNVLHFMRTYTNNLHIGARDRLTLLSSYSFDAAIMDIFGALLNGAVLYPINVRAGGLVDLAGYLNENAITIYHSTPTVYRYFLNSLKDSDQFPHLRLIVLGGEAVVKRDVELYKKHFPAHCRMINGLGPTESTVTLQFLVDQETAIARNAVPVGYPVTETEVVLLNEAGDPVPLTGEIAIRSRYVALGYWQKPEFTQAAFIPDLDHNGKRTYRTGDLGCLLPDGTIEFRGRKDFQVKIRGHRVEVGEVESALGDHSQVKECVVVASDDGMGGKRLVAYYVPSGAETASADIRLFMQKRLPDYMIPAVFVPLASMPLTPTGKIDRRALPEPDVEKDRAVSQQVAARDETESKLVAIWQDLLRTRSLGVKDNFFELGGDSLLAVHMFTRINQEFGINLPLATLFQEATIEHLAQVIQNSQSAPKLWSSLIEIEPQGEHTPFFCVHGITGDILWFRELARCLAPNYPFYGLQARGLDGLQDPLAEIEAMAAHYIGEIRRLQPRGPYLLGGASLGGTVALEIAQQLISQGDEVALLAIFDHAPANIEGDVPQGRPQKRMAVASRALKNFPVWFKDFIKMGPSKMWMRVRRWLRVARKVRGRLEVRNIGNLDATDLIDFAAELPEHRRRLIVSHFQAMRVYEPQPYPGRVTLFRAMSRPLLNTRDPEVGWQKLAPGRVNVINIPGSHEGMFKEPNVWKLAEQLRTCIDQSSPLE